VAVGAIGHVADFPREVVVALLSMVVTPAGVIALTEPLYLLPPICRPFVRRGAAGRLAGRFLYPGWPSGVLFTGLLIAVAAAAVWIQRSSAYSTIPQEMLIALLIALSGGLGTLLLPAFIQRFLREPFRHTFGIYLLILVILCVVGILATMVAAQTLDDSYLWALSWIPPVQLSLMEWIRNSHYQAGIYTGPPNYSALVTTSLSVTAFYFLALLLAAVRCFPLIREVEDAAKSAETP
jgi:cyanate permease